MSDTKYVTFKGKALYCKPWPGQVDREYSDPSNERDRGGNWSTGLVLDDDGVKLFNALGSKAKTKRIEDMKKVPAGFEDMLDRKFVTFRRYEKLSNGTPIAEGVKVTGVEEGTAIGNLSDIEVVAEVYTTEYKSKPVVGMRWVSVHVNNLVEYKKPETSPTVTDDMPPVH